MTAQQARAIDSSVAPTDRIVSFVAGFDAGNLSERARSVVLTGFFDCLGVALAGAAQPAGRAAAAFARDEGTGSTSVWGRDFTAAPALAALINGTAAHALDYDDVNWALLGHPSVSLVPTTLAIGEALGASGEQLIEAYACGFEVVTALGRVCMPGLSFLGGWHATGALGTIGATAAAARLRGLDAERTRHAIGIATSEASGLVRNFGTMTKPLHAGLAAQAAVQASGLAAAGFTADPHSLEGKHGFFACFGARSDIDSSMLDQLGTIWELEQTGLVTKPYPCGVAGHPAIDAALDLRARPGVAERLSHVRRISVGVTSYTLDKMRYGWPENELQAKFCIPYQVGRALVDGPPTLAHFTAEAIDADERVRTLAAVTDLYIDEDIEQKWRRDGGSRPCRVTIEFDDGAVEQCRVDISKGNPDNPLTRDQLRAKFRDAAALSVPAGRIDTLVEVIEGLPHLADARDLGPLLRADN